MNCFLRIETIFDHQTGSQHASCTHRAEDFKAPAAVMASVLPGRSVGPMVEAGESCGRRGGLGAVVQRSRSLLQVLLMVLWRLLVLPFVSTCTIHPHASGKLE